MKFQTTTQQLRNALYRVIMAQKRSTTLPILSCVLIKAVGGNIPGGAVTLTCTNLDQAVGVRIEADVEISGSVAIEARPLYNWIKMLPHGMISFELNGDRLEVCPVNDTIKAVFGAVDAGEFPPVPNIANPALKRFVIPGNILMGLLNQSRIATVVDDAKPALGCIQLDIGDNIRATGTDGYRLITAWREYLAGVNVKLLIPVDAAHCVIKCLPISEEIIVGYKEGIVIFSSNDIEIVSTLPDFKFPNYNAIIPATTQGSVTISRQELLSTLRQTDLFCDPCFYTVFVTFSPAVGVVVTAEDNERCLSFSKVVAAAYNGSKVLFRINNHLLMPLVASFHDENITVSINGRNQPILIEGELCKAVIMPMHVG